MPTSDEKRLTIRLSSSLVRRVDAFAASCSVSRTKAVEELLSLGLDADTAGVETALQVQSQVKRELNSLRGLVAAAVDAADTSCMLSLFQMIHDKDIKSDEALSTFAKARGQVCRLYQVKKQQPVARKVPSSDLTEGLEND